MQCYPMTKRAYVLEYEEFLTQFIFHEKLNEYNFLAKNISRGKDLANMYLSVQLEAVVFLHSQMRV